MVNAGTEADVVRECTVSELWHSGTDSDTDTDAVYAVCVLQSIRIVV